MTKSMLKRKRHHRDFEAVTVIQPSKKSKFRTERNPPPIQAMNSRQAEYLGHLRTAEQVFVLGPAGTGKTYLAATYAADLFRTGVVTRIILTRPNVPCGRSLGFFPGTLEQKLSPWAVPLTDVMRERLGAAVFDLAVKNGEIEVAPFEVMRGRSWKNSFVLLDEAQNASPQEMKMFLTRVGENCMTVVNGDVAQCDLERGSGLRTAIDMVRSQNLPVAIVEFTVDDVVRSGACAMWVRAFAEHESVRIAAEYDGLRDIIA